MDYVEHAQPTCEICGHLMTFDHWDETAPTEPVPVYRCTCGNNFTGYPPTQEAP